MSGGDRLATDIWRRRYTVLQVSPLVRCHCRKVVGDAAECGYGEGQTTIATTCRRAQPMSTETTYAIIGFAWFVIAGLLFDIRSSLRHMANMMLRDMEDRGVFLRTRGDGND